VIEIAGSLAHARDDRLHVVVTGDVHQSRVLASRDLRLQRVAQREQIGQRRVQHLAIAEERLLGAHVVGDVGDDLRAKAPDALGELLGHLQVCSAIGALDRDL
jgi:hypothetical protein